MNEIFILHSILTNKLRARDEKLILRICLVPTGGTVLPVRHQRTYMHKDAQGIQIIIIILYYCFVYYM